MNKESDLELPCAYRRMELILERYHVALTWLYAPYPPEAAKNYTDTMLEWCGPAVDMDDPPPPEAGKPAYVWVAAATELAVPAHARGRD